MTFENTNLIAQHFSVESPFLFEISSKTQAFLKYIASNFKVSKQFQILFRFYPTKMEKEKKSDDAGNQDDGAGPSNLKNTKPRRVVKKKEWKRWWPRSNKHCKYQCRPDLKTLQHVGTLRYSIGTQNRRRNHSN